MLFPVWLYNSDIITFTNICSMDLRPDANICHVELLDPQATETKLGQSYSMQ